MPTNSESLNTSLTETEVPGGNSIFEQLNEIAIGVRQLLPPFDYYVPFVHALVSYRDNSDPIKKCIFVAHCIRYFEFSKNNEKAQAKNLWMAPLIAKLEAIDQADIKQVKSIEKTKSPSAEEVTSLHEKFSDWMKVVLEASQEFLPEEMDMTRLINKKTALPEYNANYVDEALIAGSMYPREGLKFWQALKEENIRIIIAAGKGRSKENEDFDVYWDKASPEIISEKNTKIYNIEISNGCTINFGPKELIKFKHILETYVRYRKFNLSHGMKSPGLNTSSFFNCNEDFQLSERYDGANAENKPRILTHCLAGRGRTGSVNKLLKFFADAYFFDSSECKFVKNKFEEILAGELLNQEDMANIKTILRQKTNYLRENRIHAVETDEQLDSVIYHVALIVKIYMCQGMGHDELEKELTALRAILWMSDTTVTPITEYLLQAKRNKYSNQIEKLESCLRWNYMIKDNPQFNDSILNLKKLIKQFVEDSTDCDNPKKMTAAYVAIYGNNKFGNIVKEAKDLYQSIIEHKQSLLQQQSKDPMLLSSGIDNMIKDFESWHKKVQEEMGDVLKKEEPAKPLDAVEEAVASSKQSHGQVF